MGLSGISCCLPRRKRLGYGKTYDDIRQATRNIYDSRFQNLFTRTASQNIRVRFYKYFAANGAGANSNEIGFGRGVLFNRRAAEFVSLQNAEWRCVDVNRDQVAPADVRIAELVDVRNFRSGEAAGA